MVGAFRQLIGPHALRLQIDLHALEDLTERGREGEREGGRVVRSDNHRACCNGRLK